MYGRRAHISDVRKDGSVGGEGKDDVGAAGFLFKIQTVAVCLSFCGAPLTLR